jgi:hypothetical protein
MIPEKFPEHFVEGTEIARIIEPDAATHYVLRPISRLFKDRQKIANGLSGLHRNVSSHNFALGHRNLA